MTNAERIKRVERLARKIAGATTDIVTLECARSVAQAEYDLAQVRRVKAAVMSRIMIIGPIGNIGRVAIGGSVVAIAGSAKGQ